MEIPWKKFRSEEEVKRALEQVLPTEASVAEVRSTLAAQGAECSELVEGVVYCSAPARTRLFFVKAKWLMEFHFRANTLAGTTVRKGLTGP